MDAPFSDPDTPQLSGERVTIVGTLAGMSRRDAEDLLRSHGAAVVMGEGADPTVVLVAEGYDGRPGELYSTTPSPRVVSEAEMWRLLEGAADNPQDERLYTPGMLAELIGAPLAAVKHWARRGYLVAKREVGRLAYFQTGEVHVARTLASLLNEGHSLAKIDGLVAQLTAAEPSIERPLVDLAPVVQDGKLRFRRGDDLAESNGQLLLDFDRVDDGNATLSLGFGSEDGGGDPIDASRLRAQEAIAVGDTAGAIEACREVIVLGGDAADHAMLAELLYRSGDLSAARERYYAALELDADDVESRASLGCVLAELGELELAIAALRGAIDQQADFADAYYHLARVLDESGEHGEAESCWRQFHHLAPASPWAEEAATRLGDAEPTGPA